MRSLRPSLALFGCSSVVLLLACSSSSSPPLAGKGGQIGVTVTDAGVDGAGQADAAMDSAPDTSDAGSDSGTSTDSGGDAAADAQPDSGLDAGSEAGLDAEIDAPIDAATLYFDGAACSDASFTDPALTCGGPGCMQCPTGGTCELPLDCVSKVCAVPGSGARVCAAPTCTDGVQNGTETDVDCGGDCVACSDGLKCLQPTDCVDGVCADPGHTGVLRCQRPTCGDGVKNGGESDIDCGGNGCPLCALGKTCVLSASCASGVCGSSVVGLCGCPANMQLVPQNQAAGGDYCVDQYEATITDYQNFMANGTGTLSPTEVPSYCSWSPASYAPNPNRPDPYITNTTSNTFNGGNAQQGVNWCEAYVFCKAQTPPGSQFPKRMCGNVHGGSNPMARANDSTASAWYNECSAGGTLTYPYGETYNANLCLGFDELQYLWAHPGYPNPQAPNYFTWSEFDSPGDQAIDPRGNACSAAAVTEMSGDVAEWEDSCSATLEDGGISPDAGELDTCLVRGGSLMSDGGNLTCGATQAYPRDYNGLDVGIRCCWP